ncbi:MAG: polysaccharide biosynthesis C-terminal domain-containing protein [Flavobacteriales bacterium]|jgi:O-antigen/teichoic acid export membrane protein|nr:polysaccharide biosynthesis C-terminal domain-containing protein [Flavobacteriales bacterium]
MQKKFISNLLFVLALNILIKPFYILGIDAEVLKQTGEDYGIYFSLLGLTFILNIFLDFGIVNYNTRNIAQHQHLLQKHFSGIFTIRIGLSILYFILIYAVAWLLNYPPDYFYLLGILAFNQVLVAFILYLRSNLSGLLLFKQDSIISVLDRFILIGVLSYLLWGRTSTTPFQIEWFAYAQTLAYSLTLLTALFFVMRQTGGIKPRINKIFSIAIIKQSMPYAILILLMMIYYRSDAIMLERLLPNGKEETALYAQGYRFFEAFNMLGYLFAGLLLPLFSKLLKEQHDISPLLHTAFKTLFATSVIIAAATFLTKTELIEWRYQLSGIALTHSSASFGVLLLCFIAVSSTYIFGTLLTANGNLRLLNWLAFGGVILNILLNFILIPKHGAYGAAVASLFTQTLTVIGQLILSKQMLRYRTSYKTIVTILIFTGAILGLYFSFKHYISFHWGYQILLFGIGGVVLAFITKMIHLKELFSILKKD